MGTKCSVLTDEKGLPLAVVISGANTHDIKLLEETLDHIAVLRPEPDEKHLQNLCLDAGYNCSRWASLKPCCRIARLAFLAYLPFKKPGSIQKNKINVIKGTTHMTAATAITPASVFEPASSTTLVQS